MNEFDVTLGWLGFFAAAFFAWYYYLQARTKERTLLIEKGADASNFYARKPEKTRRTFCFPWLKLGLLLVGLSLGMTLSFILISAPEYKDQLRHIAPGVVFGSTIFFGGVSMIIAHFTGRKKTQE